MTPTARLRWAHWWRPRITDPNAVMLRQLCFAAVFFGSLLVLGVPGMAPRSTALVLLSVAMMAVVTATALAIDPIRRRRWVLLGIPFTDLVAVAVLRSTTGGAASVFGALLILAVISLGIERGVWPVVLTAAGCVFAVGLPLLIDGQGLRPQQWVRVVYTPTVLILTVLTIGVLMQRLRSRIGAVQRLNRAQERWLVTAQQLTREAGQQAALVREGRDELASVIDGITEQMIIATDAAGRIEVFNPGAEGLFNDTAAHFLGRDIATTLSTVIDLDADTRDADAGEADETSETAAREVLDRIIASAQNGDPDAGEWAFRRPDGTQGTVQVTVTLRRDAAGEIDGFLFVGTDVSRAREIARQKDEFVNLISHELRTPLSSILGYLVVCLRFG